MPAEESELEVLRRENDELKAKLNVESSPRVTTAIEETPAPI